jgi:hypothetical protein
MALGTFRRLRRARRQMRVRDGLSIAVIAVLAVGTLFLVAMALHHG